VRAVNVHDVGTERAWEGVCIREALEKDKR